MMLEIITCSGANEYTDIDLLVSLLQRYPRAELGIQVSGKKAAFSTARYWWIETLFKTMVEKMYLFSISLHINNDWVESFCQGQVPKELDKWLNTYHFATGEPFIKRVQLNFKIGREKTPDLTKLLQAIESCPKQRFIFSYNESNVAFIQQVYESGLKFDLLCDDSHGEGILPDNYSSPVYPDIMQGYAGGLSPENVTEKLWQICKVVPLCKKFTIDAEGKLKDESGHFSLKKCEKYLEKASHWDEI